MNKDEYPSYAGFWIRTAAVFIDTLVLMAITWPLLIAIYGMAYFDRSSTDGVMGVPDALLSWGVPVVFTIAFWLYRQATPGKMAVSIAVVDATTGNTLTLRQSIGRYFAYAISLLPLGLGFIWAAFDPKKQGWHDKLAGTVVVHAPRKSA